MLPVEGQAPFPIYSPLICLPDPPPAERNLLGGSGCTSDRTSLMSRCLKLRSLESLRLCAWPLKGRTCFSQGDVHVVFGWKPSLLQFWARACTSVLLVDVYLLNTMLAAHWDMMICSRLSVESLSMLIIGFLTPSSVHFARWSPPAWTWPFSAFSIACNLLHKSTVTVYVIWTQTFVWSCMLCNCCLFSHVAILCF